MIELETKEYIVRETALPLAGCKQEVVGEIVRCKDCKWFGKVGCAIMIADDYDKPTEDDYCSFAERREDEL